MAGLWMVQRTAWIPIATMNLFASWVVVVLFDAGFTLHKHGLGGRVCFMVVLSNASLALDQHRF